MIDLCARDAEIVNDCVGFSFGEEVFSILPEAIRV